MFRVGDKVIVTGQHGRDPDLLHTPIDWIGRAGIIEQLPDTSSLYLVRAIDDDEEMLVDDLEFKHYRNGVTLMIDVL